MRAFVVIQDRFGDQHAHELRGGDIEKTARSFRDSMPFDDDERLFVGTVNAPDAGAARLKRVVWRYRLKGEKFTRR